MFAVFLRFSDNKQAAPALMAGHKAWIEKGLADDVFLLVGSLQPSFERPQDAGGAVLAHNVSREALQARVQQDPFVAENVVTAEILEITPNQLDDRLGFLAA